MAPTANCPTCNASLQLTPHGSFDSWICPAGHGLAATLSELYEEAQEDEARRLWALARAATPAGPDGRPCPMCTRPMVAVTVPTDADEALEGEPGDTPDTGEVPVDVCVADQVIWFDVAELDAFPDDLPDPQPTAEQEAALADIRRTFGDEIVAAMEEEAGAADRLAGRLVDRIGRSSRAFRQLAEKTPAP
ncbi:MAG: hypothetical protein KF703_00885 [Actinobacteria bacterium]|nr:hypothetical protein [Actinomycetota bacterium]